MKKSRIVSVVAGLLCVGSIWSGFRVEEKAKPFFTNLSFILASAVITNESMSIWHRDDANDKIKNSFALMEQTVEKLESENKYKDTLLDELRKLYEVRKIEIADAQNQLDINKATIEALQTQIVGLTKAFEAKQQELVTKLAEKDTRFIECIEEFRDDLVEALKDRILKFYNDLDRAIQAKLNGKFPSTVKAQLSELSTKLDEYFEKHNGLIEDIKLEYQPEEIFTAIAAKYSNIHEEIATLKVRFRNILNIQTQLDLNKAYELLAQYQDGYLPKEHAKKILSESSDYQRHKLESLLGDVKENDTDLKQFKFDTDRRLDDLLNQIEEKNLIIADLKQPLRWQVATRDDLRIGNGIIAYFEPIILDRAYSDYRKHEATIYFHVDRNHRTILPSELNEHSEKLQQLLHTLAPIKFDWDAEQGLMKASVLIAKKGKTENSEDAKIPTCESLVKNSKRGFLITGHPGAGKSSTIKVISQWLGNEKTMRLALNPHCDDKNDFTESGFIELNELPQIHQAVRELDLELKLRGEDKTRRQTLIIAVDELGRILKDAPDDLDIMGILKQAAVEGRKFNIIILLGNHSGNTGAIEMDSYFRESFYQLFLVGAARHKINMPNPPKLKNHEITWIDSAPYPVLTSINAKFEACQHPTHYAYKDYQDSGYPPIGLIKLPQNPVTLGNSSYGLDPKQCPSCKSTNTSSKGRDRKRTCNNCGTKF